MDGKFLDCCGRGVPIWEFHETALPIQSRLHVIVFYK